MEQLAGLCWATCEAVVLAAGLWGAEQDAGAHSWSQPHQGTDFAIRRNCRGRILGTESKSKQSSQPAPPKETKTTS